MMHNKMYYYKTILLFVVFHVTVVSLISYTNGFSIKMIPIDSPRLKIVPSNMSIDERHQFLADITMSRLLKYQNESEGGGGLGLNEIKAKVYATTYSSYVIQVHLEEEVTSKGTMIYSAYLLFSTGSRDTWVQCAGCFPCIDHANEDFHYLRSTSYKPVRMKDIICIEEQGFNYGYGVCGYKEHYNSEKSSTSGILARNTFYFWNPRINRLVPYPEYIFGCGLKNFNFPFDQNAGPGKNIISGIFGLALGPKSFLKQFESQTEKRFAYCLVIQNAEGTAESIVSFGREAQISGDGETRFVQSISMYSFGLYHLYMRGISVEGIRANINPNVFELDRRDLSSGFFIDSGSPYTSLVPDAYNPVRSAIVRYFHDNYGWNPKRPFDGTAFDLCYGGVLPDGQNQKFPRVTFHFYSFQSTSEVNMELGPNNVFAKTSDGGFCMAIFPDPNSNGPSIFGAYQQANFKFLFNIADDYLYFVPQDCEAEDDY